MNDYSNVFLIFRVFSHDRNGNAKGTWLMNQYEDLSLTNMRYLQNKKAQQNRRPFNHLEAILPDKEWFGIKNGTNDKVFLKSRINFETKAFLDYPQIVMIQIDEKTKALCYEFCKKTNKQGFDSCSLLWNMIFKYFLHMGCLSKINKKGNWYCTKLTIDFLKYAEIADGKIDSLTATAEDIFWWCVDKKDETKDSDELPKFFVFEYGNYPENIFEQKIEEQNFDVFI